jgi:hypothetical protein
MSNILIKQTQLYSTMQRSSFMFGKWVKIIASPHGIECMFEHWLGDAHMNKFTRMIETKFGLLYILTIM